MTIMIMAMIIMRNNESGYLSVKQEVNASGGVLMDKARVL
jgi:hypothetical protein